MVRVCVQRSHPCCLYPGALYMLKWKNEDPDFPSDCNQHIYSPSGISAGRGRLSSPASLVLVQSSSLPPPPCPAPGTSWSEQALVLTRLLNPGYGDINTRKAPRSHLQITLLSQNDPAEIKPLRRMFRSLKWSKSQQCARVCARACCHQASLIIKCSI